MPPAPTPKCHEGAVTWAKNVTQHPGLVDHKTLPKWRGPTEMAKVRSEAQLNVKLTDKHLYATLKNIAKIQDRQQVKDSQANIPKVVLLLRHQDKHANTVPNTADDNDAPNDPFPEESQQVDQMYKGISVDEEDELLPVVQSKAQAEPEFYNYFNFGSDEDAGAEEPPKKKKKGDGLQDVVTSLCKNPPGNGANSKLKLNLVTKVPPPIPAPKGKKPHPLCVQLYFIQILSLTFFLHVALPEWPLFSPKPPFFTMISGPLPLAPLQFPTPTPSPPSASSLTWPTMLPLLLDPPHHLATAHLSPR
jgi:hypothetical protein